MKLNYFSSQTMPKNQVGNHTSKLAKVYFAKSGVISFNKLAQDQLDIEPGDQLTLAQDEDNPRDWYFFKDENGFELSFNHNSKYLKFNHTALKNSFLGAFGLPADATRNFAFESDPITMKGSSTQYWKIIIND